MPEYAYLTESLLEVVPGDADLRVPAGIHKRYLDARAKLAAVEAELQVRSERPLVVTKDQETPMRAAVRPGTWIVVRELETQPPVSPVPPASPQEVAGEGTVVPITEPASASAAPAGPPQRPPLGRCEARKGLQHSPSRYALTEAVSVYYPGRLRIDGICSCGLRIADVRCPHQKQELDERKQPVCKWCRKVLVPGAGNIDNRRADGSPDPNIRTTVPIGASGDDPSVKFAYRAGDD